MGTINNYPGIPTMTGDGIDYKFIADQLNAAVIVVIKGRIAYFNKAFSRLCPKKSDEVLGTDFVNFIVPADKVSFTERLSEKIKTSTDGDTVEFTMARPDGDCLVEMKISRVEIAGVPAVLGVLTDISERRRARLELQKIRDRLESIIYSMNEVVISFSPANMAIIAINPSAEALFGVPLRDFLSGKKQITDFVHPDDIMEVMLFYQRIPEVEFDELAYRITGRQSVRWVLDEGRIVYAEKGRIRRIDHVIREITDEKMALDALKQSEEKYRNFFENTSDMAYSVEPNGTFLDINDAGWKLIGYENKQQALESNIEEIWVDLVEREKLLSELRSSGQVQGMRTRLRNKAGQVFEASITARAKKNEAGIICSYEGLVHNISKAMEDQRNRVLRNAAGGMCHYLNTHLANLAMSKECILEDLKSIEALIDSQPVGSPALVDVATIREKVRSLNESYHGIRNAYDKIAQVTAAFNSAFLTYEEETYLDRTILNIFHTYGGKDQSDGPAD